MPSELDSTIPTENKQYSDEEISKILNTAKATREERDDAKKKAKDAEARITELSSQLEKIKTIDPQRYQDLEQLAQNYEEKKLEEQRQFQELQSRYKEKEASLLKENENLREKAKTDYIVNALEKSFYSANGKVGKSDDGSYFDLIRDAALKYVSLDEQSGKLLIIDPKDKTVMKDVKTSALYTVDDLMVKLRSLGPTASLFDPIGNGAGSGMTRSHGTQGAAMIREQLNSLSRADKLAKARELGID